MSARNTKENTARNDGVLWGASCSLKALAAVMVAVNAEEVELDDERFYGIGQLLFAIAADIDRTRNIESPDTE